MVNKTACILLCAVLLPVRAAYAEFDADLKRLLSASLEELMTMPVDIATQSKQPVSKAPAVVSVITADDFRATGATNLMEALQGVPGIYVKTNLFGAKPLITFRGASGANALLMVNGAPAKDLVWSPGIFWKGMPANAIERIEIIRGPGSALYGSDAASGVINVVTRTAGQIEYSEAGMRSGSYSSRAGWLQHGTHWNGFDIALTADLSHTDGHRPFIARDRLNAADRAQYGWDNQDIHFSIAKDGWRLLADHTRHDDVEIGLTGAAVLDPRTRAHDSQASLALLYQNDAFAPDWGLNAELRYRDIEYDSGNGFRENLPVVTLNRLSVAERRANFETSALYRGVRNHALRLGGGYVWQQPYRVRQFFDGVPKNFAPEKVRRNSYLFVQDVWSFAGDWELTAGARYDHYSDFGGTLNPRLALVWQTTERLTTKLMYGHAFRAPSYLELYSETTANAPNPALKPEKSRTLEMSVSWLATKDLRLGANVYRFDRRDVIAPEASAPYQFKNLARYAANGIELEAQWQATHTLRVAGNVSKQQKVDSPLRDLAIPLTQAYLRADWAFLPKWNWNLQLNWFDRRPLAAGDPRTELGSFALADTTLRYFHGSEWEFATSIRNLFDKDAREYSSTRLPDNLPLPGRNLYAEVRYKF